MEDPISNLTAGISSGILGGSMSYYPSRMDIACSNFLWLHTRTHTHCLTLWLGHYLQPLYLTLPWPFPWSTIFTYCLQGGNVCLDQVARRTHPSPGHSYSPELKWTTHPDFKTENLTSLETSQSQANRDGWSLCSYSKVKAESQSYEFYSLISVPLLKRQHCKHISQTYVI